MGQDNFNVNRRRKAPPPTGRAEAPRRGWGGQGTGGTGGTGGGFGIPGMGGGTGMGGRGVQIGGCGSIILLIIIAAFYLFSGGGGIDLGGGAPQDQGQGPDTGLNPPPQDFGPTAVSNFTPPAPAAGSGQTWTVMLYQDADDEILERDIFVDFNEAERAGSSDRVRIVSQIDRFAGAFNGDGNWTGARRYLLQQDNDLNRINSQVVQDLGEVDMSAGASLVDFVKWAAATYPADKYVLILSDHGMGWPGGWSDPDPGSGDPGSSPLANRLGPNIYLNELDKALAQARQAAGIDKFEIVGLDACLMAQMEVMTALQPHARYAVTSEETEPSLGWAYASFLGDLVTNPDMGGAELSDRIVTSYIGEDQRIIDPAARADFLQQGSPMGGIFGYNPSSAGQVAAQLEQAITISAIDLEKFPALLQAANDFAYSLQNEDQGLVAEARSYAQSYTSIFGRQVPPAYIDLGSFAGLILNNTSNQGVKQAADTLLTTLKGAIVSERHGAGKKGSTGLAIYFPNSTLYSSPLAGPESYTAIANRFASQSLWDDFLAFHYADRSFQQQAREPVLPEAGFALRAPGKGNITVSEITKSGDVAAPNQPVTLSVDVKGTNVGYVYFFTGYLDQGSDSIAVLDMDYLESERTRQVNGVFYPVFSNNFKMTFKWDPTVFAINDGQKSATALFMPQSYGATAEEATYTVEGLYTFTASGDTLNARMVFQNGNLVQVLGIRGEGDTGAPREITPQPGDTFTLRDRWLDKVSTGSPTVVYENGETLTFGNPPTMKWEQLYAAAGDYVVGFIIEDLDGNQYPVYTKITVQ